MRVEESARRKVMLGDATRLESLEEAVSILRKDRSSLAVPNVVYFLGAAEPRQSVEVHRSSTAQD